MKKFMILTLAVIALAGFSGCGKKNREAAMSEALQQASAPAEAPAEQGNFLIYESDNQAAAPAGTVPAAVESAAPTTAPAVGETSAATTDKPTIEQIQQALKGAGLYNGPIDGKLGPKSKKAIRKFQIQNNLTVDGKVGKKTWIKMQQYLSSAAAPAATTATAPAATTTENTY